MKLLKQSAFQAGGQQASSRSCSQSSGETHCWSQAASSSYSSCFSHSLKGFAEAELTNHCSFQADPAADCIPEAGKLKRFICKMLYKLSIPQKIWKLLMLLNLFCPTSSSKLILVLKLLFTKLLEAHLALQAYVPNHWES